MPTSRVNRRLIRDLPQLWASRLRQLGRQAKARGLNAFLVGGSVRDLCLRCLTGDPDVVVEGDPTTLVHRLAALWKARVVTHPQFLTFVLTFPDGTHLDVATARRERYVTPATLPQVRPARLEEDLWRRDFSMNAMALSLHPSGWGTLIDPTGGLEDVRRRVIRVLHPQSFWDDPTRIFRAARFAARYRFSLESKTRNLLREALAAHLPQRLSPERKREELWAILDEPAPAAALRLLNQWGGLTDLLPPLQGRRGKWSVWVKSAELRRRFKRCPTGRGRRARAKLPQEALSRLRRLVFFSGFTPEQAAAALRALRVPKKEMAMIVQGLTLWKWVSGRGGAGWREGSVGRGVGAFQGWDQWITIAAGRNARLQGRWRRFKRSVPLISGNELQRMGHPPSPRFREILSGVAHARRCGKIKTLAQERQFIIDNYPPP